MPHGATDRFFAISKYAAATHTHAQADVTNLVSDLAAKQPLDADLTDIAALSTMGHAVRVGANAWEIGKSPGIWRHTASTGALAAAGPRAPGFTTLTANNQTLYLTPCWLEKGMVVTNLSFCSNGAIATPVHWGFALYDAALALMAQTADQLTAAWAANTVITLALSAAQTVTTTGRHFVGVWQDATTRATLRSYGSTTPLEVGTGNGRYDAGVTTTCPSPATLAAEVTQFPWWEIS